MNILSKDTRSDLYYHEGVGLGDELRGEGK